MQIDKFKLYHYPASRSVRVKWALHEVVGNGFEVEKIALYDGALFAPTFTAADCVVGHSVFWARGYGLCKDDVFRGYLSRLSKRPAFVAAFADAREFVAAVSAEQALAARFTG